MPGKNLSSNSVELKKCLTGVTGLDELATNVQLLGDTG